MILSFLKNKKKNLIIEDDDIQVKDRHVKSIIKAISWRAVGTFDTILISWLLTGQIKIAISIGGIEVFTKIILYYFHERAWSNSGLERKFIKVKK